MWPPHVLDIRTAPLPRRPWTRPTQLRPSFPPPCRLGDAGRAWWSAGRDAKLGQGLVGGALDHHARGRQRLEVVDDLRGEAFAGRGDRDPGWIRADHLRRDPSRSL